MNALNHVAIIMDGNGRWGLRYKNSRNAGHKAGLKTVEKIMKTIREHIDKRFFILLDFLICSYVIHMHLLWEYGLIRRIARPVSSNRYV